MISLQLRIPPQTLELSQSVKEDPNFCDNIRDWLNLFTFRCKFSQFYELLVYRLFIHTNDVQSYTICNRSTKNCIFSV